MMQLSYGSTTSSYDAFSLRFCPKKVRITMGRSDLIIVTVADSDALLSVISALLLSAIGVRAAAAVHYDQMAETIDSRRPDGVVAVVALNIFPALMNSIHARFPDADSIMTVEEDHHGAVAAFNVVTPRKGIAGYLQRLSPYLKAVAVAHTSGPFAIVAGNEDHRLLALLTERERQILALVAGGMSAKQAAVELHRAVSTISRHMANIMRKLDLHDRVALALFAVRVGSHPTVKLNYTILTMYHARPVSRFHKRATGTFRAAAGVHFDLWSARWKASNEDIWHSLPPAFAGRRWFSRS